MMLLTVTTRAAEQGREQAHGEREVPQVVRPELQLEPLGHDPPAGHGHHPGVVDQQVEIGDPVRQPGHRIQVGQVKRDQFDRGRGHVPHQRVAGNGTTPRVAAGHQHDGAMPGQFHRDLEADAGIGAGHQGGTALLARHVGGSPPSEHDDSPITRPTTVILAPPRRDVA
jgi:hypothetical protein